MATPIPTAVQNALDALLVACGVTKPLEWCRVSWDSSPLRLIVSYATAADPESPNGLRYHGADAAYVVATSDDPGDLKYASGVLPPRGSKITHIMDHSTGEVTRMDVANLEDVLALAQPLAQAPTATENEQRTKD